MKKVLVIVGLLLAAVLTFARSAPAVSYPLTEEQRDERAARGTRDKGEDVCLFQSGTVDVRQGISIGDVLTVYRQQKNGMMQEVGKIRVISYVGEDFLRGEVDAGQVMTGDVAKKGGIASLVISSDERCVR